MSKNKHICAELTEKMISVMKDDNYSYKVTDRSVNYIYRALTKFCIKENNGYYSPDIGKAFLDWNKSRNLSKKHWNTYINSINRLDHALNGDWHWRPVSKQKRPYTSSCFNNVILKYEKYLVDTGKTESDIRCRMHVLARFLKYIEVNGVTSIGSISVQHLYSGFQNEGSKDEFRKSISSFIRYAFRNGMIQEDISIWMPTFTRHKPVPTVYSLDEITSILGTINRNVSPGKRNYCIILIAARLGLRSCDIAGLAFDNIHYDSHTISLIQKKTGKSIRFPLLSEIMESLDDYIYNERPKTNSPYIFVSIPNPDVKPLKPHTIYAIVSRTITKSMVNTKGKRKGAHALTLISSPK